MQLDQNPFFRKTITAWYDSSFVCWFLIVIMVFVCVFSLAGVIVVLATPSFGEHLGFPCFLAFLSGFLALKVLGRIWVRSKNN